MESVTDKTKQKITSETVYCQIIFQLIFNMESVTDKIN